MRILIVEDEQQLAENIKQMLEQQFYVVDLSDGDEDVLKKARLKPYDLIILDWMLPDQSGIEICNGLRDNQINTPVLLLTAKSQLNDKIEGLESGADDYLTKPFEMKELIARVKALLRRQREISKSPVRQLADLAVNMNTREVKRNNKAIDLSPREFALLEYLLQHEGKVLNRTELLEHVWGDEVDPFSNTVDVHIRYLRKKIDTGFAKQLIHTIRGKGYMLCEK